MKAKLKYVVKSLIFKIIDYEKNNASFPITTKFGKAINIDNKTEIGEHCYIGDFTTISNTSIGNYCSIAANVTIGPGEHDYSMFSSNIHVVKKAYPEREYSFFLNKTLIGNDVWIGKNAVVLSGKKIGNGAVIGAGCIVTKNVPDYAIVVGNPGRIIKYRFSREEAIRISSTNWWNLPINEAAKIARENNL